MLLTTTLCLLALGVVMVFSASSTTSLLGRRGRRRLLPQAHGALRNRRPVRAEVPRLRRRQGPAAADGAAHGPLALPAGRRDDPGRRHRGERRQALDRRWPLPDPAVGDRQGRADPLRRPAPRHPTEDDALDQRDGAVPSGGRRHLWPGRARAGPWDGDGRVLRRCGDADRGRRPDAGPRDPGRGDRRS